MDEQCAKAIFYPDSIAVVGASGDAHKPGAWYLQNLISGGYKGKLFPVNPKGGKIFGLEAYADLKSIPDQVDYVIVCVPKEFLNDVLDDCAAKK